LPNFCPPRGALVSNSPAWCYEKAVRALYDRHLCRVPWPDCLERGLTQMADEPTRLPHDERPERVPCDRVAQDLERPDRLRAITTPTLLVSGRTTRRPRTSSSISRAHLRLGVDDLRGVESSAPKSRSRRRFWNGPTRSRAQSTEAAASHHSSRSLLRPTMGASAPPSPIALPLVVFEPVAHRRQNPSGRKREQRRQAPRRLPQ
jgi:hypothetical protein